MNDSFSKPLLRRTSTKLQSSNQLRHTGSSAAISAQFPLPPSAQQIHENARKAAQEKQFDNAVALFKETVEACLRELRHPYDIATARVATECAELAAQIKQYATAVEGFEFALRVMEALTKPTTENSPIFVASRNVASALFALSQTAEMRRNAQETEFAARRSYLLFKRVLAAQATNPQPTIMCSTLATMHHLALSFGRPDLAKVHLESNASIKKAQNLPTLAIEKTLSEVEPRIAAMDKRQPPRDNLYMQWLEERMEHQVAMHRQLAGIFVLAVKSKSVVSRTTSLSEKELAEKFRNLLEAGKGSVAAQMLDDAEKYFAEAVRLVHDKDGHLILPREDVSVEERRTAEGSLAYVLCMKAQSQQSSVSPKEYRTALGRAIPHYRRVLRLYDESGNGDASACQTFVQLGIVASSLDLNDAALWCFRESRDLRIKNCLPTEVEDRHIATVERMVEKRDGDILNVAAKKAEARSATILVDSTATVDRAKQLLTAGKRQFQEKKLTNAESSLMQAVSCFQYLGKSDASVLQLPEYRQSLSALATVYYTLGVAEGKSGSQFSYFNELSLPYYVKVMQISSAAAASDDDPALASTLFNLGCVYVNLERFEAALKLFERCRRCRAKGGQPTDTLDKNLAALKARAIASLDDDVLQHQLHSHSRTGRLSVSQNDREASPSPAPVEAAYVSPKGVEKCEGTPPASDVGTEDVLKSPSASGIRASPDHFSDGNLAHSQSVLLPQTSFISDSSPKHDPFEQLKKLRAISNTVFEERNAAVKEDRLAEIENMLYLTQLYEQFLRSCLCREERTCACDPKLIPSLISLSEMSDRQKVCAAETRARLESAFTFTWKTIHLDQHAKWTTLKVEQHCGLELVDRKVVSVCESVERMDACAGFLVRCESTARSRLDGEYAGCVTYLGEYRVHGLLLSNENSQRVECTSLEMQSRLVMLVEPFRRDGLELEELHARRSMAASLRLTQNVHAEEVERSHVSAESATALMDLGIAFHQLATLESLASFDEMIFGALRAQEESQRAMVSAQQQQGAAASLLMFQGHAKNAHETAEVASRQCCAAEEELHRVELHKALQRGCIDAELRHAQVGLFQEAAAAFLSTLDPSESNIREIICSEEHQASCLAHFALKRGAVIIEETSMRQRVIQSEAQSARQALESCAEDTYLVVALERTNDFTARVDNGATLAVEAIQRSTVEDNEKTCARNLFDELAHGARLCIENEERITFQSRHSLHCRGIVWLQQESSRRENAQEEQICARNLCSDLFVGALCGYVSEAEAAARREVCQCASRSLLVLDESMARKAAVLDEEQQARGVLTWLSRIAHLEHSEENERQVVVASSSAERLATLLPYQWEAAAVALLWALSNQKTLYSECESRKELDSAERNCRTRCSQLKSIHLEEGSLRSNLVSQEQLEGRELFSAGGTGVRQIEVFALTDKERSSRRQINVDETCAFLDFVPVEFANVALSEAIEGLRCDYLYQCAFSIHRVLAEATRRDITQVAAVRLQEHYGLVGGSLTNSLLHEGAEVQDRWRMLQEEEDSRRAVVHQSAYEATLVLCELQQMQERRKIYSDDQSERCKLALQLAEICEGCTRSSVICSWYATVQREARINVEVVGSDGSMRAALVSFHGIVVEELQKRLQLLLEQQQISVSLADAAVAAVRMTCIPKIWSESCRSRRAVFCASELYCRRIAESDIYGQCEALLGALTAENETTVREDIAKTERVARWDIARRDLVEAEQTVRPKTEAVILAIARVCREECAGRIDIISEHYKQFSNLEALQVDEDEGNGRCAVQAEWMSMASHRMGDAMELHQRAAMCHIAVMMLVQSETLWRVVSVVRCERRAREDLAAYHENALNPIPPQERLFGRKKSRKHLAAITSADEYLLRNLEGVPADQQAHAAEVVSVLLQHAETHERFHRSCLISDHVADIEGVVGAAWCEEHALQGAGWMTDATEGMSNDFFQMLFDRC